MACHVMEVLGVLEVLVRPLENGIPCGRSSHWKVALLAGGPTTSSGTALQPLANITVHPQEIANIIFLARPMALQPM